MTPTLMGRFALADADIMFSFGKRRGAGPAARV